MTTHHSSSSFHFVNILSLSHMQENFLPYPSYPKQSNKKQKLKTRTIVPELNQLPGYIRSYLPHFEQSKIKLKRKANI